MSLDFIRHLENLIGEKYFEHFYLVRNVFSVYNRNIEPNRVWTIGNEQSWILCFCAEGQYHIYGDNWVDSQLLEFLKHFDWEKIPDNFYFTGNRFLIEYLISKDETIEFKLFKNREFYEATRTLDFEISEDSIIRLAEIKDLDELTIMNCTFFNEEYEGENDKDFDEMKEDLKYHIEDKKFFVIELKSNLIGFCSVLDTEFNNPMIGTIFIKPEFRNKSYAKPLLKFVTDIVLKDFEKCWLMTDEKSLSSNKMVKKVGYEKIYDYTSGTIKKL